MRQFFAFIGTALREWVYWLSGSVPMVGVAVWQLIDPKSFPLVVWQISFLIFGIGIIVAIYRVYNAVRIERDSLREKLVPKFSVYFDPQSAGIFISPVDLLDQYGKKVASSQSSYVRIQIEAKTFVAIEKCSVSLVAISKKPVETSQFINVQMPHNILLRDNFTVRPKIFETADFASAGQNDGKLSGAVPGWPLSLVNVFSDLGIYRVTIAVNSGGTTRKIDAEIEWNGKWNEIRGRQNYADY